LGPCSNQSVTDTTLGARKPRKHSLDLIRLEEGLAKEFITPYLTPTDYLEGCRRFSARWRQNVPIRRQASVKEHGSFAKPNVRYCVVSPATVREGESFDSAVIVELEIGAEVAIVAPGACLGRRVQIQVLNSDMVGWVSLRTKSGIPLFAPTSCKDHALRDRWNFGI